MSPGVSSAVGRLIVLVNVDYSSKLSSKSWLTGGLEA